MIKSIKIVLFSILLLIPITAFCEELETYSNYVLVYNLNDNEILYEKNVDERVSIASLTKIMSVIVALENIDDINKSIFFPKISSLYGYSKMGFEYEEALTYEDLLYSAILPSAADATEGLGILISGSTSEFVNLMNSKAGYLNMNNTHFSNTYGKDSNENYSTVSDLLKLMLYALNNEQFYKIFTTKNYTLSNGEKIRNSVMYYNKSNNLDTSLIKGAKTGYTNNAGYCMISIYEEGDVKLLIITTNADYKTGKPLQVMDGINIGNYYLDNYEYITLLDEEEYIGTIKIFGIKESIFSDEEIRAFLPKGTHVNKKFNQNDNISFKSKVNDKIGEYVISYGDKVLSKDIKVPNTFKVKLLLFLSKYLRIISWITRFVILK